MIFYQIKILPNAIADLENIYNYIAYNLKSPLSAKKTLDKINSCINSLDLFPRNHQLVSVEPWKSQGYRYTKAKKYLIIYQVDDFQKIVSIYLIKHETQNLENQLKDI